MAEDSSESKIDWKDIDSHLGAQQWRSRWLNSWHAINYLSRLPRKQLSNPHKGTERFLVVALVVVAVLMYTPAQYVTWTIVFCDLLFGSTLLMFIAHRFGILSTLSPEQAAIVWDLIVSISLFVVFVVVHLTAAYFMLRYFVGH